MKKRERRNEKMRKVVNELGGREGYQMVKTLWFLISTRITLLTAMKSFANERVGLAVQSSRNSLGMSANAAEPTPSQAS